MSTRISSLSIRTTVPSTTSPCLKLRMSASCSASSSSIVVGSGPAHGATGRLELAASSALGASASSAAASARPRRGLGDGLGPRRDGATRLGAAGRGLGAAGASGSVGVGLGGGGLGGLVGDGGRDGLCGRWSRARPAPRRSPARSRPAALSVKVICLLSWSPDRESTNGPSDARAVDARDGVARQVGSVRLLDRVGSAGPLCCSPSGPAHGTTRSPACSSSVGRAESSTTGVPRYNRGRAGAARSRHPGRRLPRGPRRPAASIGARVREPLAVRGTPAELARSPASGWKRSRGAASS